MDEPDTPSCHSSAPPPRVKISSQSNDQKKKIKQTNKNKKQKQKQKRLILIKKAELKKKKKVRTKTFLQDMCKNHQGLQQKKEGICQIYYLWVTLITPDIYQILQEKPNGKLKMVLFRKKK